MQLLYSFRFQQIGETFLGAAVGPNAHLFNGVLQLNEVGHFIVSELARLTLHPACGELPASPDASEFQDSPELSEQELTNRLADSLTKEYAVDRSTAQSAVQQVLDYLKAEQVLA